jgi:hypothetical protein
MKQKTEVIEQWLSDTEAAIEGYPTKFNDWEKHFIQDIRERFDRTGFLSDATIEKLEQIYYKA